MQDLSQRKALKKKEEIFFSQEDLPAFSLQDLQAALACQIAWGVSDIFDDFPGISLKKSENIHKDINPFSLLSPSSRTFSEEKKTDSIPKSEKRNLPPESTSLFLEKRSKASLSKPAVEQVSITALTANLQTAKTIEEALACAREFGGAGLAQTALHDIKGKNGFKGGGFLVGAEPSQESERAGEIFAGQEGVLMKRLLASIDISADSLGSAPALPWRPPGGRDPLPEEVERCAPLLRRLIALSAPKWVVTFGSLPARMLLEGKQQEEETQPIKERLLRPSFRLSQVKGRWHQISLLGIEEKINIFPLMAPSRLKNSARMRQSMWQDLQLLKQGLADILEK